MDYVQSILKQDHAISTDGERLYVNNGDVYQITYDYYDHDVISDLTLISEYDATLKKVELIKLANGTEDVTPINTDRFNGIWFNVDGFEVIVLDNNELSYASNNIVDGDIYEIMPDHYLYDQINLFYPY